MLLYDFTGKVILKENSAFQSMLRPEYIEFRSVHVSNPEIRWKYSKGKITLTK